MLKLSPLFMAVVPLLAFFNVESAKTDFIYGIGDDNHIDEVDINARRTNPVFSTGVSGLSNAIVYDAAGRQLFFMDADRTLRVWNGGSALPVVATTETIGGSQPATASYFNNNYGYFEDGTIRLNQLMLKCPNLSASTVTGKTTLAISCITNPCPNNLGGIAIDGTGV